MGRKQGEDSQDQEENRHSNSVKHYVPLGMGDLDSTEDRKQDLALFQQIRSTSDYHTLFTNDQLSSMSLE